MTLLPAARKILNAECEAAAMEKAAWASDKPPEVVVDDSIGRLIRTVKALTSKNRYAPARPGQRPRGDEGGDSDDDDVVDEEEDDEGAEKKRRASSASRKRRASIYTSDSRDMSTPEEHAKVSEKVGNTANLPTSFYETAEFLEAEAAERPLYPLFKHFAGPVFAWLKEGARVVVCCLDKGTVKAKARTAKKRAEQAKKRKEFPYPDNVRMTAGGSLYDESKRGSDGRFAYVPMDYDRLMLTRRLRNEAFEWFARAFAEHSFPPDGALYMDYADATGKMPIAMEIKHKSIKERNDLSNSYGEGDIAILNWLTYFSDKNCMVSAVDGDMFGILSYYLHSRVSASKDSKQLEKGPALYWSDHAVFRNMNVLLMCLRELGVHPIAVALLCIFSTNDFFLSEDKKLMLNRLNSDTIWRGLRAVPIAEYNKFSTWLETLHKKDANKKSTWRKLPEKEVREAKRHALSFVRTVQKSITDSKPERKTKTTRAKAPSGGGAAPVVRKTGRGAKIAKGQEQATGALSDIVVGNLEYWYFGRSIVNPEEFTAIVGLQWRALTRTRSELDRDELGDLERMSSSSKTS